MRSTETSQREKNNLKLCVQAISAEFEIIQPQCPLAAAFAADLLNFQRNSNSN